MKKKLSLILLATACSLAASYSAVAGTQAPLATKNINSTSVVYPAPKSSLNKTYVITTTTGRLTKIVFPVNTKIISIAASDSLNWSTVPTYYGLERTPILLIKPTSSATQNELFITTNHGMYSLNLLNTHNSYMSTISFSGKIQHPIVSKTTYIKPQNYHMPTMFLPKNENKVVDSAIFIPGGAPMPPKATK